MDVRESVNNTDTNNAVSLYDRIATFGRALTAKELAELLNVSPITIFKQAKRGIIPCFRIGTCVRFEPKKTADWFSQQ